MNHPPSLYAVLALVISAVVPIALAFLAWIGRRLTIRANSIDEQFHELARTTDKLREKSEQTNATVSRIDGKLDVHLRQHNFYPHT